MAAGAINNFKRRRGTGRRPRATWSTAILQPKPLSLAESEAMEEEICVQALFVLATGQQPSTVHERSAAPEPPAPTRRSSGEVRRQRAHAGGPGPTASHGRGGARQVSAQHQRSSHKTGPAAAVVAAPAVPLPTQQAVKIGPPQPAAQATARATVVPAKLSSPQAAISAPKALKPPKPVGRPVSPTGPTSLIGFPYSQLPQSSSGEADLKPHPGQARTGSMRVPEPSQQPPTLQAVPSGSAGRLKDSVDVYLGSPRNPATPSPQRSRWKRSAYHVFIAHLTDYHQARLKWAGQVSGLNPAFGPAAAPGGHRSQDLSAPAPQGYRLPQGPLGPRPPHGPEDIARGPPEVPQGQPSMPQHVSALHPHIPVGALFPYPVGPSPMGPPPQAMYPLPNSAMPGPTAGVPPPNLHPGIPREILENFGVQFANMQKQMLRGYGHLPYLPAQPGAPHMSPFGAQPGAGQGGPSAPSAAPAHGPALGPPTPAAVMHAVPAGQHPGPAGGHPEGTSHPKHQQAEVLMAPGSPNAHQADAKRIKLSPPGDLPSSLLSTAVPPYPFIKQAPGEATAPHPSQGPNKIAAVRQPMPHPMPQSRQGESLGVKIELKPVPGTLPHVAHDVVAEPHTKAAPHEAVPEETAFKPEPDGPLPSMPSALQPLPKAVQLPLPGQAPGGPSSMTGPTIPAPRLKELMGPQGPVDAVAHATLLPDARSSEYYPRGMPPGPAQMNGYRESMAMVK